MCKISQSEDLGIRPAQMLEKKIKNFIHNISVTENVSSVLDLVLRLEFTHKFGLAVDIFVPNIKPTLCKAAFHFFTSRS